MQRGRTEADPGVRHLQAKGHLEPPRAKRGKVRFFPEPSPGHSCVGRESSLKYHRRDTLGPHRRWVGPGLRILETQSAQSPLGALCMCVCRGGVGRCA